jgi:glucoamylase
MLPDKGGAAFGHPGIAPNWTQSRKEGIVTAYHTSSRVWATLSRGVVNEVYFPTVDSPQVRDLQYLATDGESFFHEERRDLEHTIEPFDSHTLGYRLVKEIISSPHLSCLVLRTRLEGKESF